MHKEILSIIHLAVYYNIKLCDAIVTYTSCPIFCYKTASLPAATELVSSVDMPSFFTIYLLDAVIVKVRMSLDELFNKSMSEVDPHKQMEVAHDLLKATVKLIEAYAMYIR